MTRPRRVGPAGPRSKPARLSRRAFVAATTLASWDALALGRLPTGGRLELRVPFATSRLDPHDLFDPLAAVFGSAIADTVYARDARGVVYPSLADGMPTVVGDQTVVRLRPGLRSAHGRALGGRALAWSVARARKLGAAALFARVTDAVRSDRDDPLIARFGAIDPQVLALLLTSPLCALLPVGFDAAKPDGSGAFMAKLTSARMDLSRNPLAARGPSQLEGIIVRAAVDLADSLRAFESGADDVGWQGMGFYGSRPEARAFSFRDVGWVVLVTGTGAGASHVPGMAQRLANAVPLESMHVGLSARPGVSGGAAWTGGDVTLDYDGGTKHLAEVARSVAAKLSGPQGTITPRPMSRASLRRRRQGQDFALALDVVRHAGSVPAGDLLALATAESIDRGVAMALKPTSAPGGPAHSLTRSLHVGVLGGLAVQGGIIRAAALAPDASGHGVDWGASYRH